MKKSCSPINVFTGVLAKAGCFGPIRRHMITDFLCMHLISEANWLMQDALTF